MMSNLRYFTSSLWVTAVGLALGALIGHYYTGTMTGALSALFIVAVLSVLEVSLSFDNAVVNATVLKDMNAVWRHRFLTWGMLIAVFGMRLLFPLVIVGVVAHINPWNALVLAAMQPDEYARIMKSVHVPVAAFGGSFLLMVALKYFFDTQKEVHWIRLVEEPLTRLGRMQSIEIALGLLAVYGISLFLHGEHVMEFMVAGIFGIITFVAVDGVSSLLEAPEETVRDIHKASAGMFLYLEVLDASFSFDGVVGAFAITNNLFIISIGLGVGAMFVRSLTILLVDKGTLTQYLYLEHGAFYAIAALAGLMFVDTFYEIPEAVTGLAGAGLIALSFWSSVRHNKKCGPVVLGAPES